jgi:hypothetical protein
MAFGAVTWKGLFTFYTWLRGGHLLEIDKVYQVSQ